MSNNKEKLYFFFPSEKSKVLLVFFTVEFPDKETSGFFLSFPRGVIFMADCDCAVLYGRVANFSGRQYDKLQEKT